MVWQSSFPANRHRPFMISGGPIVKGTCAPFKSSGARALSSRQVCSCSVAAFRTPKKHFPKRTSQEFKHFPKIQALSALSALSSFQASSIFQALFRTFFKSSSIFFQISTSGHGAQCIGIKVGHCQCSPSSSRQYCTKF